MKFASNAFIKFNGNRFQGLDISLVINVFEALEEEFEMVNLLEQLQLSIDDLGDEFGIETRFAHLSKISVKVGQRVSRGDLIGAMGNSGRSTGTHLHYEVRVGGNPVDPMIYIKAARDVL